MSQLHIKVRYILLPLVALAVGFLVVYSALDWLLVARTDWVPLGDEVVGLWLPVGLAWLAVILWIQPGIRLLRGDSRQRVAMLYHLAAVLTVAVPTFLMQEFVRSATGELTHLHSLAELSSRPGTKYYSADDVCLDLTRNWSQPVARMAGSRNDSLNFYVFAAVPLCLPDREAPSRSVWVGYEFHKLVGNQRPGPETDAAFKAFIAESRNAIYARDPNAISFFERLGRGSNRKDFAALLRRAGIDLEAPSTVVLIPHTESFEDRTDHKLQRALIALGIAATVWLGITLFCPLDSARVRKWREQRAEGKQRTLGVLAFLIPKKGAYGLQVLILANVLVFLAMVFAGNGVASFDTDDLLRWGANYRPALHGLGYVRLITSQFVHGGILHLLNNMYGLLFAGIFLLPITDNLGLIVCYLLAGLGGAIASAYVDSATISVGASGAIFGLFGILLVHLLFGDKKLAEARRFLLPNAGVFVVLNLLIGAASPGIDNTAHVGGLFVGIVLGALYFLPIRARSERSSPV